MNKFFYMRSFVFYIFIFLISFNLKSQELVLASELYPELRYHYLKGEVFYFDYRQVKGTPYLIDDWMIGNINLDDGKELKSVRFKLDIFVHRIIIYHENLNRMVLAEKKYIAEFSIQEGELEKRFKKIEKVGLRSKAYNGCYYEVLTEDVISLYKLYYKDKIPARNLSEIYVEEFTDETDYLIAINNEYKNIRLSKAYFILNYPEYKVQIKKYIRKNRLKLRKEKDFIVAIDYLNEIYKLSQSD